MKAKPLQLTLVTHSLAFVYETHKSKIETMLEVAGCYSTQPQLSGPIEPRGIGGSPSPYFGRVSRKTCSIKRHRITNLHTEGPHRTRILGLEIRVSGTVVGPLL